MVENAKTNDKNYGTILRNLDKSSVEWTNPAFVRKKEKLHKKKLQNIPCLSYSIICLFTVHKKLNDKWLYYVHLPTGCIKILILSQKRLFPKLSDSLTIISLLTFEEENKWTISGN